MDTRKLLEIADGREREKNKRKRNVKRSLVGECVAF